MAKDKQIGSLPDSDQFWSGVDNDHSKEYMSTCVIEKIRNASPKTDIERIELIAQLKLFVELLDSPKAIYQRIMLSKIEEQERKEIESVI